VLITIRDQPILVARHKQDWSETDEDQLIASAELAAFERGWDPPLASWLPVTPLVAHRVTYS
jgi:hypothetical protein